MLRMLRRGSQVGKYRLERRLGTGAFATVWQARDTIEHRRVAPEGESHADEDGYEWIILFTESDGARTGCEESNSACY